MSLSAVLVFGSVWFALKVLHKPDKQPRTAQIAATPSSIAPLSFVLPQQRAPQLDRLARRGTIQEKNQARYLLAVDLIQQQQAEAALKWLKDLDQDYLVLASETLMLQAQARTLAGKTQQATQTWQTILDRYPKEPAAAEALYVLGQDQPQYWDQAIASFPAHPRTVAIAVKRLQANPNQLQLLRLIAKHGLYLPNYTAYLDRLTQKQIAPQLTPQDWQTIAFGYWEKQAYKEGGLAYARAPQTSQNAYRAARGLQLGNQNQKAIAAYQQMIAAFPQAKETPTALLKLASLTAQRPPALRYFDQAIQLSQQQNRPQQVGAALLAKARFLKQQGNAPAATQVQQTLFQQYAATDAASELRWQLARKQAQAKNWSAAREVALAIVTESPQSDQAPAALFWAGKWSQRLGNDSDMTQAFQQLWRQYPQSYYTWRAATLSGWQVGDFSTVRYQQPSVVPPRSRLALAAGSPALQELYQLGQSQTAWTRWQWEFDNREQPTLPEQLTDGLLRLGVGDFLDGMYMLTNLAFRVKDEPQQQPLYQQWRQDPGYGYALYPLAYWQPVTTWSQPRNLNPILVLSLMRQESRFQPKIRSVAGATGLMQVMPDTADWISGKIDLETYDLEKVQDNINLGTWYLDYTHRTYQDNSMLAIASYNAGPGNVATWLQERPLEDVDEFVEAIPFNETQNYVKAVFENHWNYLRLYNPEIAQLLQQNS